MKKPNLNQLQPKDSVAIAQFKVNPRTVYLDLHEKPIMLTNKNQFEVIMVKASQYNELLAYTKELEKQVKGK